MYISLSFKTDMGQYQLILEGNKNDYTNNTSDQILLMIPIFNDGEKTIKGPTSAITQMNNLYIDSIFKNMALQETYNFSYKTENTVDMNLFLTGNSTAVYFPKIIDSNIKYKVIVFDKSNLFVKNPELNVLLSSLISRPSYNKLFVENSSQKKAITVESNGIAITSTIESDIYIDCSPTNNIGEAVDIYTSKDLDQLKFFKINDLRVWAFRLVTIFVILLIIFIIIKIFQVTINGQTNTATGSDARKNQ